MGLRDIKKSVKDGWDQSVGADIRQGADSAKAVGRLATKDGRAAAALEKQEHEARALAGREAAASRAVSAADRGDIRAEEQAITEAHGFPGGPELIGKLVTEGRLRRGAFIGSVGLTSDRIWVWRDRIIGKDGLVLVDDKTKASVDQAGNLPLPGQAQDLTVPRG